MRIFTDRSHEYQPSSLRPVSSRRGVLHSLFLDFLFFPPVAVFLYLSLSLSLYHPASSSSSWVVCRLPSAVPSVFSVNKVSRSLRSAARPRQSAVGSCFLLPTATAAGTTTERTGRKAGKKSSDAPRPADPPSLLLRGESAHEDITLRAAALCYNTTHAKYRYAFSTLRDATLRPPPPVAVVTGRRPHQTPSHPSARCLCFVSRLVAVLLCVCCCCVALLWGASQPAAASLLLKPARLPPLHHVRTFFEPVVSTESRVLATGSALRSIPTSGSH
ncbi:hypothetical protein HDK90DRAFT_166681 [Phyllosticta capitalensis]|uniref:Transmembrane protein n=1 Tax=Phyllosticta capitalensis TaxID=121624 RepID=A0ABR1YUZ9_9PEZI